MTTLISLIGEQPIPILLPVRYLKPENVILVCSDTTKDVALRLEKMIPNSSLFNIIEAYNIVEITEELQKKFASNEHYMINLSGGTKPMSIAAYDFAKKFNYPLIYLQSEKTTQLYRYHFQDKELAITKIDSLPELITIDDYLKAHVGEYIIVGPHKNESGKIDDSGMFELTLAKILQKHNFEVQCGVRPKRGAKQIEIDLIIRRGNNIGIIEAKLGFPNTSQFAKEKESGQKRGLDQLAMEGAREYLGIYAEKFYVTAKRLDPRIRQLAVSRKMTIIELENYQPNRPLQNTDEQILMSKIKEKFS